MRGKKGEELEKKTYVISSVQASYEEKFNSKTGEVEYLTNGSVAELHEQLMQGLERRCNDSGGELILLSMAGKNAGETIMHESLDPHEDIIFHGKRKLNSNVAISDMIVPPQNVDPSTGRDRFVQQDTTLIYAHPKQRLKAIPSSNYKLPKLLVTTGAVTTPNYKTSNHRGDVAERDHLFGAVIVETIGDKFFNVRHVRAQKDGKFVDMGLKYDGNNKPKRIRTDSLILGDLHVGDTDPKSMHANYEMIDFFQPQNVFVHDLFNGHSVNPHEKDLIIKRALDWSDDRLYLDRELQECNIVLRELSRVVGKKGTIYIVSSNHDDFLNRYLDRGEFSREPWNLRIASELAYQMSTGKNPLEYGINKMGKLPSNIDFLELDEDVKRWGYQCASHGHRGNSGARRASAKSKEIAYGKSITGHTHTPEIFRDTYVVGTSTHMDLPYTHGSPTSWMAANAVIYEGGLVQLLPIINGKWKMKV